MTERRDKDSDLGMRTGAGWWLNRAEKQEVGPEYGTFRKPYRRRSMAGSRWHLGPRPESPKA